jgi:hypothetical protein
MVKNCDQRKMKKKHQKIKGENSKVKEEKK